MEEKHTRVKLETAVLGGGCFWCTEAIFERLTGVLSVMPGYAGGPSTDSASSPQARSGQAPSYNEVSTGKTGHAEVIEIKYDPSIIKYSDLLNVFFALHDPTTMNRQGSDVGTQYRSIILYTTPAQKKEAEVFIKQLTDDKVFDQPIVTETAPLKEFYEAEDYHHDYYNQNKEQSYCQVVINPKIAKLRAKFASLLKPE